MVACVGVGVVMPLPGVVVVTGGATVDDAAVVDAGGVVELVDEAAGVVELVEGSVAGSPWASTQYDFPTSRAQVAGREGFCGTGQ